MKTINYILCLAVLCSSFKGISQEFSFYLHFQDALGNKDSLLLGYDSTATKSWDAQWGETNIIDQPWDSTFEVRVTTTPWNDDDGWIERIDTFQSKVWIGNRFRNYDENSTYEPYVLGQFAIKTSSFPVTISFDSEKFENSDLKGILLTCVDPGGWWDVTGCGGLANEKNEYIDEVIFSRDSIGLFDKNLIHANNDNRYINSDSDTLYYFWFAFGEENLGVSTQFVSPPERFRIYPNPVSTSLSIDLSDIGKDAHYQIFDLQGKQIKAGRYNRQIDVSEIRTGLYTLYLYGEDKHYISKFSKL